MSDEFPRRAPSLSPPVSSFVYPVRSLLSTIQPASRSTDIVSSSFRHSDSELRHSCSVLDAAPHAPEHSQIARAGEANDKLKEQCDFTCADREVQTTEESGEPPGSSKYGHHAFSVSHMSFSPSLQLTSSHIRPQYCSQSPADSSQRGKQNISGKMSSSPIYRHFPREERDPNLPRTFSSVPVEHVSSCPASKSESQNETTEWHALPFPSSTSPDSTTKSVSLLPSSEFPVPSVLSTNSLSPLQSNRSLAATAEEAERPIHVQDSVLDSVNSPSLGLHVVSPDPVEVAPAIFSGDISNSEAVDSVPGLPYNISQYGLVQLPPPPSPAGVDYRWPGTSMSSRQNQSDLHVCKAESLSSSQSYSIANDSESSEHRSASLDLLPSTITPEVPSSASRSTSPREGPRPATESELPVYRRVQPGVSSIGDESSGIGSTSESGADVESIWEGSCLREDHAAFRFQYAQDDNGYHVVVGREGKLQRCEDEVRG